MSFSTMAAPTGASWRIILPAAITKVFPIDDEEVLDALISESDELAHICKLYQCKMASQELPKLKLVIKVLVNEVNLFLIKCGVLSITTDTNRL